MSVRQNTKSLVYPCAEAGSLGATWQVLQALQKRVLASRAFAFQTCRKVRHFFCAKVPVDTRSLDRRRFCMGSWCVGFHKYVEQSGAGEHLPAGTFLLVIHAMRGGQVSLTADVGLITTTPPRIMNGWILRLGRGGTWIHGPCPNSTFFDFPLDEIGIGRTRRWRGIGTRHALGVFDVSFHFDYLSGLRHLSRVPIPHLGRWPNIYAPVRPSILRMRAGLLRAPIESRGT